MSDRDWEMGGRERNLGLAQFEKIFKEREERRQRLQARLEKLEEKQKNKNQVPESAEIQNQLKKEEGVSRLMGQKIVAWLEKFVR